MSSGIELRHRVVELLVLVLMSSALTTALSNPCFSDYSSLTCLGHIAKQRAITYASAAQLRNRALQLYENEQSSPSAVYDALTLAVACLAYPGTWKPGPDSDCTMCLPSHIHQSPQEVCDLYCVPSAITKTTVTDIEASLADITENNKCTSILTTKLAVFIGAAIFILVILLPVGLLITYILYKICKTCHRDKGGM